MKPLLAPAFWMFCALTLGAFAWSPHSPFELGRGPATFGMKPRLHVISESGPSLGRINLVFLSEGYTDGEEEKFIQDAKMQLQSFFEVEPYKEYQAYFNSYAVFYSSRESGTDNGSNLRNTAFDSYISSDAQGRLIRIRDPREPLAVVRKTMPEATAVAVLVNTEHYGGSGGVPTVISATRTSSMLLQHEFAHMIAGLGDEYELPYPGYPVYDEPNTSRETRPGWLKWKHWLTPGVPIPTPDEPQYADAIGAFEGARYNQKGWYRPKLKCKMRTINHDFCEICRESIVRAIYKRARPIRAATTRDPIVLQPGKSVGLVVETLSPASHPLTIRWSIDGKSVGTVGADRLNIFPGALKPGRYEIMVSVSDETPWVRHDPENLLRQELRWSVEVK